MRSALKILGIALLSLLALLVAAFGALQTPPGKAMLASLASSLASSPGLTVAIRGLGGFVPFDVSVETIELADAQGPFARIEGARLDWRPLALLSGRVDVTDLGATRVTLDRRPQLPPPSRPIPRGRTSPCRCGWSACRFPRSCWKSRCSTMPPACR
ncbi:hypothetical protein ACFSKM_13880 [Ancylobacter dichloromethanicus]